MGSELRLVVAAAVILGAGACAPTLRPFAPRAPLAKDTDMNPVSIKCRKEPTKTEPDHVSCAPEVYVSPLAWDGIDNSIFRPFTRVFKVAAWGEAPNVNSLDEVADSSWFTNHIGEHPMTPEEVAVGACEEKQILADSPADGSWPVDQGKNNGSSLGFRVNIPDKGKYLLKVDGDPPERPTAATVIGTSAYRAVGYNTACEQIIYFKASALKLKPGLKATDNTGRTVPFDEAALAKVIKAATPRGDQVRMGASSWLPGFLVGPFRYEKTRSDDPNDIIDHEDRRELRGMRLLAAWLDHFDSREQNTMDTWISSQKDPPDSSPGYVRHFVLDTSDCLGSEWAWDGISKRLGYSYLLDWGDIGEAFVTLGLQHEIWDTIDRTPGRKKFGYWDVNHFVADEWKNEYPNPAFSRMTERDGAWMARIMAHFTPAMVKELAKAGEFTDPGDEKFVADTLEGRLQKILERYLTRLSPIGQVHVEGDSLCATDLAELRAVRDPSAFHYDARLANGAGVPVTARGGGNICVPLVHGQKYFSVTVSDGVARGSLVAWLYDVGDGFSLAGVERPEP